MANSKVKSASDGASKFPKGGKTKMFGKGGANPMPAGVTAKMDQGGAGAKFPSGGSGKMFGKGSARPAVAGRTAKTSN